MTPHQLPPRVQQIADLLAKHAAKIANPDAGRISIVYSGNSLTFRVLPPEHIEVDERCSLLRRAV